MPEQYNDVAWSERVVSKTITLFEAKLTFNFLVYAAILFNHVVFNSMWQFFIDETKNLKKNTVSLSCLVNFEIDCNRKRF